ncbi:MAG: hypothetical protein M1828_000909 [Chrysothrix sp. TS-e1954]|nr:MAG: hypothetical protein M1828_000909 [Chrysothrix sp. TS-e1954]
MSDIEEQQRLAESYQPDLELSNISERIPLLEFASQYEEHARYSVKLQNLVRSHHEYRKVKGDGNCGWRALIFAYFEILDTTCHAEKITSEEVRLKNLVDGLSDETKSIFEDPIDQLHELFVSITKNRGSSRNPSALPNFFNSDDAAHVVYLFRVRPSIFIQQEHIIAPSTLWSLIRLLTLFQLLTSLEMRSHQDDYGAYLIDTTVDAYCASVVEMPDRELEEITLQALTAVLHRPAGFGVTILMLVDSPGTSVDHVSYSEMDTNLLGVHGSDVNDSFLTCLLFRPTHYDIVYRVPPAMVKSEEHTYSPETAGITHERRASPGNGPETSSAAMSSGGSEASSSNAKQTKISGTTHNEMSSAGSTTSVSQCSLLRERLLEERRRYQSSRFSETNFGPSTFALSHPQAPDSGSFGLSLSGRELVPVPKLYAQDMLTYQVCPE